MDSYDDCDYCTVCERHSVNCYCFTGPAFAATDEDDLCHTPDQCGPLAGCHDGVTGQASGSPS